MGCVRAGRQCPCTVAGSGAQVEPERGEPAPPLAPRAGELSAFVAGLVRVPWFVCLGEDGEEDGEVTRLRSFDAWAGPEDEGGALLNERLMEWTEALDLRRGGPEPALAESVRAAVEGRAIWNVAYEPDQDPWYGPNAAVQMAGFVATLVAQHLAQGRPVPAELGSMWRWLARGHWPAGYDLEHDPPRLVVL